MQEEDYREEVKKDKQEFVRKVFDEADRKYQIPIDVEMKRKLCFVNC